MADPFIGEIKIFAGTYAPRNWALCEGQLLDIASHDTLFSLLGTIYGGNGTSNFALPDFRGRIPVHAGAGPGLTTRHLGERFGTETATINSYQMPPHEHNIFGSSAEATIDAVGATVTVGKTEHDHYGDVTEMTPMASAAIGASTGGHPHYNIQPSLCLQFIIALAGIYPSRN